MGYDDFTGEGGTIVLAFQDNRCADLDGTDIMIYEGDTVPTIEAADRCARPQIAAEVIPLTLD